MKTTLSLAAMAACYSLSAQAQTERDLESHEHGSALLNVAITDSTVFVELSSPWNNLVGFEHAPHTDEQHAAVDSATQKLNDPMQLFVFDGGDCQLADLMIESTLSMDEGEHEDHDAEHDEDHDKAHDDDHDEDHDKAHDEDHDAEHDEDHDKAHDDDHDEDHDKAHDDDHDAEHDEDHHDDHDEASGHSSVLATYTFQCNEISKLKSINLALFSIWPGFKELDVQMIGDKGQTLVELNAQNTVLDIE